MNRMLKISYWQGTAFAIGATFLIWFLGIGGRDLPALPLLCWLPFAGLQLWKGKEVVPIDWTTQLSPIRVLKYGKWVLLIFFMLFCVRALLLYFKFQWNIWDSGVFSNIIYNMSQGELWWSHYEVHPWADHFTPSIGILAPFYLIYKHFFWIVLAKILAYCSVPWAFWQLAQHQNIKREKAVFLTWLVSSAWLIWYKPAVSSLYYEWQPSCLAPPIIVFCFLWMEKREWAKFSLGMIFLLGLKEHMGIVPLGFGCYWILQRKEGAWIGFLLVALGFISIFFLIYNVMPYFRENQPSWSVPNLDFWGDLSGKLIYSLKLLLPLAFLPLLYFRIGILAGPAIGVNIVAGREAMRSMSYHYDDVSSTLLLIAMLVLLSTQDLKKYWAMVQQRAQQVLLLSWLVATCLLLPSSIGRELREAWPTEKHLLIHQELNEAKKKYPLEQGVAVQSSLGVHFQQREVNYIAGSNQYPCGEEQADRFHQLAEKRKYWLLAREINFYFIDDLGICVQNLLDEDDFEISNEFTNLILFIKK